MTSFLGLCEQLSRESGAVGRAPTAVTGQTGRQARVVGWVATAWTLIQNISQNWSFLQAEHAGTLVPGAATYTAASFNTPRFGDWLGDSYGRLSVTLHDPAIGRGDERHLRQIGYDAWRDRWDFGAQAADRPTEYALAPDQSIRFGAAPDRPYALRFRYRKAPQLLAANGDVPDMPERFHDMIVWRAIMLMADHDEAPDALTLAGQKYRVALAQLMGQCLPAVDPRAGGPMA